MILFSPRSGVRVWLVPWSGRQWGQLTCSFQVVQGHRKTRVYESHPEIFHQSAAARPQPSQVWRTPALQTVENYNPDLEQAMGEKKSILLGLFFFLNMRPPQYNNWLENFTFWGELTLNLDTFFCRTLQIIRCVVFFMVHTLKVDCNQNLLVTNILQNAEVSQRFGST